MKETNKQNRLNFQDSDNNSIISSSPSLVLFGYVLSSTTCSPVALLYTPFVVVEIFDLEVAVREHMD